MGRGRREASRKSGLKIDPYFISRSHWAGLSWDDNQGINTGPCELGRELHCSRAHSESAQALGVYLMVYGESRVGVKGGE